MLLKNLKEDICVVNTEKSDNKICEILNFHVTSVFSFFCKRFGRVEWSGGVVTWFNYFTEITESPTQIVISKNIKERYRLEFLLYEIIYTKMSPISPSKIITKYIFFFEINKQ